LIRFTGNALKTGQRVIKKKTALMELTYDDTRQYMNQESERIKRTAPCLRVFHKELPLVSKNLGRTERKESLKDHVARKKKRDEHFLGDWIIKERERSQGCENI